MEATSNPELEALVPDLYRFALLAMGDKRLASSLVEAVCTSPEPPPYGRTLKLRLSELLYRRTLEAGVPPLSDETPLSALPCSARALLALRFGSGLTGAEALAVSGLDRDCFYRSLSEYALAFMPLVSAAKSS